MIEANQTIRNQNQRTVRPQEMLPSQELQEDQVLQQAEMQRTRCKRRHRRCLLCKPKSKYVRIAAQKMKKNPSFVHNVDNP